MSSLTVGVLRAETQYGSECWPDHMYPIARERNTNSIPENKEHHGTLMLHKYTPIYLGWSSKVTGLRTCFLNVTLV